MAIAAGLRSACLYCWQQGDSFSFIFFSFFNSLKLSTCLYFDQNTKNNFFARILHRMSHLWAEITPIHFFLYVWQYKVYRVSYRNAICNLLALHPFLFKVCEYSKELQRGMLLQCLFNSLTSGQRSKMLTFSCLSSPKPVYRAQIFILPQRFSNNTTKSLVL